MSELMTGEIVLDGDSVQAVSRRLGQVGASVRAHLLAPALEAACQRMVAEATRRDRPLAWNDVTGNLRASIRYQLEGYKGADPFPATDGSGVLYNSAEYRSGHVPGSGEHGVVFAPPDYAVNVEAKSTRSVLLEPAATLRGALLDEVADVARREWMAFVLQQTSRSGRTA